MRRFETFSLNLCLIIAVAACSPSQSGDASSEVEEKILTCRYENPFSRVNECRAYYGGWTSSQVDEACSEVFTGVSGTVSEDPCVDDQSIGICTANPDEQGLFYKIWFYGGDSEISGRLCGDFLNGSWESLESGESMTPPMSTPLDEALDYMTSTPEVLVEPECVDDVCLNALVEARQGISFSPVSSEAKVGLIIYPGAQVDPRAYAPVAQEIAEHGVRVVIVPMPDMFALNGWDRATTIMETYPEVESWYLSGHSMGGAMTAHFAKENPGLMRGLILWAAYPGVDDDLSQSGERVMSIYGNMDGVATVQEVTDSQPLLPADTQYVEIQGANHAQFGLYGVQDGDLEADISAESQHQQIAGATLHFIGTLESSSPPSISPIFSEAPSTDWCGEAQVIVAGLETPLPSTGFEVREYTDVDTFARSKPIWDSAESVPLQLSGYVREHGNALCLSAPPILAREVWCKLKSRALLQEEMADRDMGPGGSCKEVNEAALQWAMTQLPDDARARLNLLDPDFEYQADEEFGTGLEWLGDGTLSISDHSTDDRTRFSIRSASLKVGDQSDLPEEDRFPEEYRNVVYCKLLAPAEAFRWLLTLANTEDP